ncbi:hypothetical protein FB107DRAFT_216046 [Schizophyllum commune]
MNELGPPRPVEGLWFDDGNIILRAGNSVHKLHKSILSLHSTILADMFGIPQPDVAESYDGLPVVELPDAEADVVHWLKSLLVPGYFEIAPSKISTDKLFAALRLSHKYDCQYLRRRSLVHLSTMFATDVGGMRQLLREFPASCSIKYTSDELQTYCTALSVAREVGATWLLPDIYFNLHVLASGPSDALAEALSKDDPLTAADIVSVYKVTNLVHRFFHIPDLVSLWQSCMTGKCATGSGANLNGLAPALYTDPITFFMPPSPQNARQYPGDALEDVLCQDCMCTLRKNHGEACELFWAALPSNLGLDGWKVLRALKSADLGDGMAHDCCI